MPEYLSPGVYIEDINTGAKTIEGVNTSTAGFIGMAEKGDLDKPTPITSWVQFVDKFGRYTGEKPYLAPAVSGFFANGGNRCYIVRVGDSAKDGEYIGSDRGPGGRTGLQALNELDEVKIICIPGITSGTVQKAMVTHCETRRNCFCILDPIKNADIDVIQAQKDNVVSEKGYAALYYPWIKVAIETLETSGKVTLIQDFVPPSGHLAGIYARLDMERGVHKAPANEIIRGALKVKPAITKGAQDILNPLGINCIRVFPGRGVVVWGARTTSSDAPWKYITVRRLSLFIEESIEKGIRWVVFEPNNETLWARVTQAITQFLIKVWRDGALMGATPEKAFFVKCDRTTMTKDDISKGRLIIVIGMAPLKPAEFVIFRIAQLTGGSQVSV